MTDETSHRRKHIGLTLLKWVSAILLVGLFVLLAAYLIAVALGGQGGDKAMPPAPVTTELITRGAYLARAGDCSACHTAPGAQAFAGGLAIASPIGVIFSTNITPDRRTGIGGYTYGEFERAVRRGVSKSGETLYPAMPYPSYSRVSDDDMAALYAYFTRGVTAVSRKNSAEHIAWPMSMRWPLTYWRWLLAPHVHAFAAAAGETPIVARGAYLVEGLGHCGACHTARAITMQEVALTPGDRPRYLAGSQFNGWFAPSLRGGRVAGLGRWAGADIEEFLASGKTGKYAAFGEMGAVVLHSTQFKAPADRDAIVSFLQTLPPAAFEVAIAGARSASASPADGSDVRAGAQTYLADCADCHAAAGTGHASSFPALAGNPVVNTSDPASLIHIVLAGGAEVHTRDASSSLVMPPFGKSLSDAEIADLLTYVRSSWGNHAPPVSPDQVKTLRRKIGQAEPAGK